mgnify:CR=1 FL=1
MPRSPRAASGADPQNDLGRQALERHDRVGVAGARDGARHAPHHAAAFVLHDHLPTGGRDARGAVAARPDPCR